MARRANATASAPECNDDPTRGSKVARVLVGLVALAYVGLVAPVTLLSLWISSALGVPWGWAIGIVTMTVPIAVIAGLMLLSGVRPRSSAAFAAGTGTVIVIGVLAVAAVSVRQPPLLRSELDKVGVPSGWRQTDESADEGGCLDGCAYVLRTYEVQGPRDETLEQLAERFEDHGYDLGPVDVDELDETDEDPDSATATAQGPGPAGYLSLDAASEDDLTEVDIRLKGG